MNNNLKGNTMNDYNEGDLVEAVNGETVIRGRLKADDLGLHLWVGDSGRTPENIESYGFTITVIKKAPPKVVLPTEPGIYSAPELDQSSNGNWHTDGIKLYALNTAGKWADVGWGNPYTEDGPFTRLEPVPETAKKVIEYLEDSAVIDVRDSRCAGVRAHFGVEL